MTECPFCKIVRGDLPADFVLKTENVVAFVPLNPVTEGHVLVIPRKHVPDFTFDPGVTAETAKVAAELSKNVPVDVNLITSAGPYATQTVYHLHFHIVPRTINDGLKLPWST